MFSIHIGTMPSLSTIYFWNLGFHLKARPNVSRFPWGQQSFLPFPSNKKVPKMAFWIDHRGEKFHDFGRAVVSGGASPLWPEGGSNPSALLSKPACPLSPDSTAFPCGDRATEIASRGNLLQLSFSGIVLLKWPVGDHQPRVGRRIATPLVFLRHGGRVVLR